VADETIRFLEDHAKSHRGEPFYVNVWFKDVHTPFRPTAEMLQPFQDLPEPSRTHYAMVHFMDAQIGRVLATLDKLGLRDRTLVIFSSDNGAAKGRGGSNGALRAWKWWIYEGGIRVPLIVRWPGRVPHGRTDEASVLSIVDFMPTFCRLAGASMPDDYQPDGVDITDALQGRPFRRSQPLFWHHPTAGRRSPTLAVRDGDWKLLMDPDGSRLELYELATDPAEGQNVAERHPEVVRRLRATLLGWYRTLPEPYGDAP
jgi:N-acetylgalactosamine-6-sulfatase